MMNQNLDYRIRDQYQAITQKIKLEIPKTLSAKSSGERNLYFLFLGMVYLYLNSDRHFYVNLLFFGHKQI